MTEGVNSREGSFWREGEDPGTPRDLKTLVNSVDNGIYQLDAEGRFVAVNDTIVEMTGYSREELLGEPVSLLLDDDDIERIAREIQRRLASDESEVESFEFTARTANGKEIVCELQLSLLLDDGDFQGTVGVVRDVTDRKRVEQRLAEERDMFADGPAVIFRWEPDEEAGWPVEYVSENVEDLLGYTAADLESGEISYAELLLEEEIDRIAREVEENSDGTTERFSHEPYRIKTKDGDIRWVKDTTKIIRNESGQITNYLGYLVDITERKRRERELEESEHRYRTLVENFPNGAVALVDEDLNYQIAGGTPVDVEADTADDLTGAHIREAISVELADALEPRYRAALDGEASQFELEHNGRHSQIYIFPVRDDDGEVFAAMGMSQDITERKEYERDLRDAKLQLEAAAEAGAVGTWEWHVHADEIVADPSFARLFGVDPDAARDGAPIDRFLRGIHEGDRERVERRIQEALDDCGEYEAEYRVRDADEELRWVLARGHVECDENDTPVTFPGAIVDISDRKRAEQQLERSEQRYRTLVENFPDGVVAVYDHDLRYTLVEGSMWDELGHTPEDVEGKTVQEFFPPETAEDLVGLFQAAINEGEAGTIQTEFVGRIWRVWAAPLRDGTGDIFAGLSYAQDVTDQVEWERELQASNERLEQFAYAASHDLQEPLRMVSSYLQLLEGRYAEDLDDDAEEFLEFAVDGADRMREMIDGLLEYSRVDTQGDPLRPVDLNDVFADVREDLQLRLAESDAELTVEDLPRVEGDPDQLRQVFQNLLDNAITYSGDEPPRLDVGAERAGDQWIVSVEDEGIGIGSDDQARIFDVFDRLHTQEEFEGTGIGLALCERIVERHGGDIWVDSEPGEGTTIFFTLSPASARNE